MLKAAQFVEMYQHNITEQAVYKQSQRQVQEVQAQELRYMLEQCKKWKYIINKIQALKTHKRTT